ncbi:MAG: beta-galactosidase [Prevotella sp.]|nr:beta-galactosidase [Prevotella sp.]
MQAIYNEVRTPYKYGIVVAPADNYHKFDCPTVFREGDKWLMTYVCYDGKDGTDGRGYETWLAQSSDLLHWQTLGTVLALPLTTVSGGFAAGKWDQNQRGGFPALIDHRWAGSYQMQPFKGRHWMTYIGGPGTGYEAVNAPLSIGIASTRSDIATAHQWETQDSSLLSYNDRYAQWWEQLTQYKSTIYWLQNPQERIRGYEKFPFVMFYNAGGKDDTHPKGERIGIALSKDMKHWQRYPGNPVFAHDSDGTITGDAQIVRMDIGGEPLWVMFYFSAFNPSRSYNAFNTFAVSRDLLHWQDWTGPDLIVPSKPYDEMFAHKSCVVKHNGVVYHFYCAVNNDQQRGIAVATSQPMGRSEVRFPAPEPTGRRTVTSLNDGWTSSVCGDSIATQISLPHNFDDYYGYRQLRHGNLHGSAIYNKMFACEKKPGKRYFLQFEGVGTYATVTLNGHEYPRELVGRTVWTLDITDALISGNNELQVLVDHPAMNTESPWVCGGCSSEWGFSEGSQPFGIFRPVTLVETDEVRIEPFGVHIWANTACDSVFIDTEVKNYSSSPRYVELVNKFAEKNGRAVFRLSQGLTIAAGETRIVRQSAAVADAHRWSLSDPYLYTLTSMLKQPEAYDGDANRQGEPALVTTDDVRTPFGIRSLSWPAVGSGFAAADTADNRFRLNGQPVFINGTCEYEHLLGASHAFSPEQIRSRIKQIRNAGFNAFREAHQPHNLLYQQLLDEQGLLFWSQFSAHIWYDTSQFHENFKRLLVRWIKERRNSPSIILWGLQNESVLPRDFAEECTAIIRSLDPTASTQRLVTTCNGGEGTDWNVVQNWSGTYGGNPSAYAEELSRPDQLLNGEYGAWRTLDLHGPAKYSEESFTALLALKDSLARVAFSAVEISTLNSQLSTLSGVCGHFQWLFSSHDNPGRVQPDGALRRIDRVGPVNYKGLTTIWEEPTQGYYMYRRHHAHSVDSGFPAATPADRNRDLLKGEPGYHYFYRINCGGDAFVDEFGQLWQADDSIISHSWGQDFPGIHPFQASQRHITDDIRGTDSDELFQYFRFGRHRLWYDIPVYPGPPAASVVSGMPADTTLYRIELYFTEPWHGRYDYSETADYEGLRIFDVAVNDSLVINDLDPWAEAGYCGTLKRVVTAKAKDGRIRISFPEVKAGQAVICGIAISCLTSPTPNPSLGGEGSIYWHSLDTDTISRLPREELPQDTEARPAVVYEPQPVAPMDVPGITSFVIHPGLGQEYALRFRYKNLTGLPVVARMRLKDANGTVLVDRDITFPPTPDKFRMLSTTTGTQINAGTYQLTVESLSVEFKNVELQ